MYIVITLRRGTRNGITEISGVLSGDGVNVDSHSVSSIVCCDALNGDNVKQIF